LISPKFHNHVFYINFALNIYCWQLLIKTVLCCVYDEVSKFCWRTRNCN